MRYEQHPYFDFNFLEKFGITPAQVKKYSERNHNKFLSLCKDKDNVICMTRDKNTEWVFRTYSATKMIMAATLLLNNAEYCMCKNSMAPVPYLLYYAAFSSARAYLYASPFKEISLDERLHVSHNKALELVPDLIKNHINREIGKKAGLLLNYLRNQRELFSYKFPASGIRDEVRFDEAVDMCGLLAELTELSSYKIQEVYEKRIINSSPHETEKEYDWMNLNQDMLEKLYKYDTISMLGERISLLDDEDCYRVGYIDRKVKHPSSIMFTMTEGMTEDFFGAWYSFEDNDDSFNPDLNWNRIFPIP
ncbi:MAG: hypothetical protein J1F66_04625 [Clostridiales bacterium]|nr:hypothetical protein [Clostridiales bacterium]